MPDSVLYFQFWTIISPINMSILGSHTGSNFPITVIVFLFLKIFVLANNVDSNECVAYIQFYAFNVSIYSIVRGQVRISKLHPISVP